MPQKIGPITAIKLFFGFRPGDDLKAFKAEVDTLPEADKLALGKAAFEALKAEGREVEWKE